MASDVVLERATAADSPAIRTVLARAYRTNPLMTWVLPDDDTREDACAAWLGPSVDRYLAGGRVDVARLAGEVVGVAAWRPAGPVPAPALPSPAGVLAALVGPARAQEVLAALGAAASLAPAGPAAYLNYLAVVPDLQGRAIGRWLVEVGIAAADAEGVGTFLGTTDPRNLPFYARLGCTAAGTVALGPGGPVLTVLHRAQGSAAAGSPNHITVSP